MYGIVLTGAVCPKCDTNCRDSFRKLLLLVATAELNGDAYLTIPILLNTSSSTIVHNVRHRHIRARVWIMIISIILYRLIVYYVLSAVCVFNLSSTLSNSHLPVPLPQFAAAFNRAALSLVPCSNCDACSVFVWLCVWARPPYLHAVSISVSVAVSVSGSRSFSLFCSTKSFDFRLSFRWFVFVLYFRFILFLCLFIFCVLLVFAVDGAIYMYFHTIWAPSTFSTDTFLGACSAPCSILFINRH